MKSTVDRAHNPRYGRVYRVTEKCIGAIAGIVSGMARARTRDDERTGEGSPTASDAPRFATDDEFDRAYGAEKPRWAELAERLK
ncbi:hypothetical protein [uncultured Williamsia sp.]|uniref:hypothetical protein n=1 Tax=uncultured Williamsia sp. TaxID=259311 RepID=UPI002635EC13|nr:hypothetical protein [uncultured Williamsia sp.]